MTTQTFRYQYTHETAPIKIDLPCDENASHGDHWAILTDTRWQSCLIQHGL